MNTEKVERKWGIRRRARRLDHSSEIARASHWLTLRTGSPFALAHPSGAHVGLLRNLHGANAMRHAAGPMVIPKGLFKVLKEILRHLLKRPVVGITIVAEDPNGRIVLIRRSDSGQWALPGGTVEWGETLRGTAVRELREEAGVETLALGELAGVYSAPERDPRFHAVTVVVRAKVHSEMAGPENPVEIREACFFSVAELPKDLSHGTGDMLQNVLEGRSVWE